MQLPSKTINPDTKIRVRRSLPVPGEILVQRGEKVEALQVVARAEVPRRYRVIDVARLLGRLDGPMEQVMAKGEGEAVKLHEIIAVAKGGLPFFQRPVRAPADGRIAAIGQGWVLLETEAAMVEVQAFINGIVSFVAEGQAVVIEGKGTKIEAACGFGGEACGSLKRLIESPFEPLTAEALDSSVTDAILLGGSSVDEAALRRAEELHVRGIITGSFEAGLLKLDPPVRVRVVATEGFGNLPISPYTFGVLFSLGGKEVSIRGYTPGWQAPEEGPVDEPAVVMATTTRMAPLTLSAAETPPEKPAVVRPGSRVRVTYGHLLGSIGIVASLPDQNQVLESGLSLPGAVVKFDDTSHYIPWANLEQIL